MQFAIVLLLLIVVVVFVSTPLRRQLPRRAGRAPTTDAQARRSQELEDLEAAREAKYREIRDAELDLSTGKLSDADFRAVDSALRAEAIGILKALDRADSAGASSVASKSPRTSPGGSSVGGDSRGIG